MSKRKNKMSIKTVVALGILIAMEIALSRFMSFSTFNMKIGFAFIPVAFAGQQYGKYAGAVVGGVADVIGAVLFPIGPYFPGFTLTSALVGFCFGLLLHKKLSVVNIVISVLITQIFGSLLLNTLWISILYGSPYFSIIVTRSIQVAIMSIVQIVVLPILLKSIDKPFNKIVLQ